MLVHNFEEWKAAVRGNILRSGDRVIVRVVGPGQEATVKYHCGGREGLTLSVGGKSPEFFPWGDLIEVEVFEKTLWDFLRE